MFEKIADQFAQQKCFYKIVDQIWEQNLLATNTFLIGRTWNYQDRSWLFFNLNIFEIEIILNLIIFKIMIVLNLTIFDIDCLIILEITVLWNLITWFRSLKYWTWLCWGLLLIINKMKVMMVMNWKGEEKEQKDKDSFANKDDFQWSWWSWQIIGSKSECYVYSNIWIFLIQIFIRIFVRIIFLILIFLDIRSCQLFGYKYIRIFVRSKILIWIYSDLCSYQYSDSDDVFI